MKKENELKNKESAAARLAARVVLKRRAKQYVIVEPAVVDAVIEPVGYKIEPVDN